MFYKPPKIKYTDMAIYIDSHIYTDQCDDTMVFEYLYHLIYMLARKHRFFNMSKYYDQFSLYGASRVFMRLKNTKQFKIDDKGNSQLNKLKSILNYLKKTIYFLKVDFEQEEYGQIYSGPNTDTRVSTDFNSAFLSDINALLKIDFGYYLENISSTLIKYLNNRIKYVQKDEKNNLIISCMLTLHNIVDNAHNKISAALKIDNIVNLHNQLTESDIIIYGVDKSFKKYILVLVNELKALIIKELQILCNSNIGFDFRKDPSINHTDYQENIDEY